MEKYKTKTVINDLAYQIVGCCIEVHKELGPGLLEEIYEEALSLELRNRGFSVRRQVEVPVIYVRCKNNLRLDILVEECIIVECKACDALHPIHGAKLLTYMKLADISKGLLINFNVLNIVKEGLKPLVNQLFKELPS